MKRIVFLFISVLALSLQSCRDNFNIEMPVNRSYQQDVTILNQFVDINKTTYEYYVNPNKHITALSYVTNSDADKLNDVSPTNLNSFKENLAQVSILAKQMSSAPNIDYIVMMTNSETYISQLNRNSPINIQKIFSDHMNHYPTMASLNITETPEQCSFYGKTNIDTSIELNPESYNNAGWAFAVTCEIKHNGEKEQAEVLFCGVGYKFNPNFGWSLKQSYSNNIDWNFKITGIYAYSNLNIARFNFLDK